MLPPVVTIDVMPADVPAEFAPVMVMACSQALPEGACALASATPESAQPDAVALVLWQGDRFLEVTVRVGRHGSQWLARRLTFAEGDSLTDRFTAVGLTVATLVGEGKPSGKRGAAASAAAPHAASPVAPQQPPARTPTSDRRWQLSFDLAGLLSSGWQGGEWQRGAWAAARLGLGQSPFVAEASGSYAVSNGPDLAGIGSLHSQWFSAGIGLGAETTLPILNLRTSALLELLIRRVTADVQGSHGGDTELPVRVRALGAWPARSPVAVLLGGALRLPLGRSDGGEGVRARQPLLELEVLAGVEARL